MYNGLMEKPNRIREIFEDFYDAERVDMQGFLNYEDFKKCLESVALGTYFNPSSIKGRSNEDSMVDVLWKEGAGNVPVLSDPAVTMVFLPLIKESVGNSWFRNIAILVHFPKVRITNEYDKFIDITHLWAKVQFTWEGKGKGYFGLNRSEYTMSQFRANFLHSHVNVIPTDDFTRFASPCTGSGPINSTMATLSVSFDDAIWQLFCLELDKFTRVESISGVPYHKLETVGTNQLGSGSDHFAMVTPCVRNQFWMNNFTSFVKHLLESKVLSFNYKNNQYGLAMSWIEFMVTISNSFIEWYNSEFNKGRLTFSYKDLIDRGIIKEVIIQDGKVYFIDTRNQSIIENIKRYIGKRVCTFKGKDITLNITDVADFNSGLNNRSVLLSLDYAELILGGILRTLNYGYGKGNNTGEEASSLNSKRRFI